MARSARDRDLQIGTGAAVLARYERVCFERAQVRVVGAPPAHLIAPGHPLLNAVVDLTIEQNGSTVKHGTVLVDRTDVSETPRLLVVMSQQISDGHSPARVISKRFDFNEVTPSGEARAARPAPYLDFEALPAEVMPAIEAILDDSWLARRVEDVALEWAIEHPLLEHAREVESPGDASSVTRTRQDVRMRLLGEINFWDGQHAALLDRESVGHKLRLRLEAAYKRARDLESRLEKRLADLDADERLTVHPPLIAGGALVVPQCACPTCS